MSLKRKEVIFKANGADLRRCNVIQESWDMRLRLDGVAVMAVEEAFFVMYPRLVPLKRLFPSRLYCYRLEKMAEAVLDGEEQLNVRTMTAMAVIITWLGSSQRDSVTIADVIASLVGHTSRRAKAPCSHRASRNNAAIRGLMKPTLL